jgi:hypothetical protein
VGGGPTRPNSTPERLFSGVDRLLPGWESWLGFENPATRQPYAVAAPIISRGLGLIQDGNRALHAVDLASGSPLYPPYPAFGEGGPCSGPAAAGEYFYLVGPPGRLVAFSVSRLGREESAPGHDPVPDYGIDIPRKPGELWESYRPPTVNEVAGRVVCLWRTVRVPHRYRLTCTTLDCAQRLPDPDGSDFADGPWEWDRELPGQPLGQPVLTDGGALFLFLDPDLLRRIDVHTGEHEERRLPSKIRDGGFYAPEHDLLVLNTLAGDLVALRGDSMEEAWTRRSGSGTELFGPGCYVPGLLPTDEAEIWTVDLDGNAEATRAEDGVLASGFPKLESISQVTAPPSVCGDALLVPMGHDLILARRTGKTSVLLATMPPAVGRIAYQVAVAYERVVVATDRWKVMAYHVPEGTA